MLGDFSAASRLSTNSIHKMSLVDSSIKVYCRYWAQWPGLSLRPSPVQHYWINKNIITVMHSSGAGFYGVNAICPTLQAAFREDGFRGGHKLKSGEAVKRLDRLAPNLVYVCGFVWEWMLNTIRPSIPQGVFGGGGGLGGHKFKSRGK